MSPLIARLWEGSAGASDADRYLAYLRQTGLADYERTAGNRGVLALRRLDEARADFLLISVWESESETVRHLELVHPTALRLR